MIPIYRFLEVALYSLLNFLPFLCLAVYSFRKYLRYSYTVTTVLVPIMCLLQIVIGFFAAFSPLGSDILSVASTFVYAAFLFVMIKDEKAKIIFVLLSLFNIANLVTVSAKCLEGIFFGDIALEAYRWSLSVCMLLLHLLITVPVGLYIRKFFISGLPFYTHSWHYLWAVPATFYLIWFYHLYGTGQDADAVALIPHNAIFLLFINLGAFAVYHIAILLLREQQKAIELGQENQLLEMQKQQSENPNDRINEARRAKHDVRHHAILMREYLRNGKLKELDAYLESYTHTLPDNRSIVYCRHYATNVILSYFAQQASDINVEMDIFVQLPETMTLPETVFSVILGNLLENSLDACCDIQSGERRITVRGRYETGAVYFDISNNYEGELRRGKSGELLTTKKHGSGLGLLSVSHIVKNRNGIMELNTENGIFRVSLMMPDTDTPAQS